MRAKSKNRKESKDKSKIIQWVTLISTISTLGLGGANLWVQTHNNQLNYDLQVMTKRVELSDKIQTNVIGVVGLQNKAYEIFKDEKLDGNSKQYKVDQIWKNEFPVYDANIKRFQEMLAGLDGEKPEPYNFEKPALVPPVTDLRVTIK